MDAAERTELYTGNSVQSRRDQRSPGNRAGVSQHQAVIEWATSERLLYELEHEGRLVGIHVGNRVWYSRAQLIALLGEPKNPIRPTAHNRARKSNGVTGGQLSFDEIDPAAEAA